MLSGRNGALTKLALARARFVHSSGAGRAEDDDAATEWTLQVSKFLGNEWIRGGSLLVWFSLGAFGCGKKLGTNCALSRDHAHARTPLYPLDYDCNTPVGLDCRTTDCRSMR